MTKPAEATPKAAWSLSLFAPKAPKTPPPPPPLEVPAFGEAFGQRYQSSREQERGQLMGLAAEALRRLPALDPQGVLAAQLAGGQLDAQGISALQRGLRAHGATIQADGVYGPRTHAALTQALQGALVPPQRPPSPPPAPEATLKPRRRQEPRAAEAPAQGLGLGTSKEGHTLKRSQGRATSFANGHISYKGWADANNRQNRGLGAWGDRCAPTDYFCALPDPLRLGTEAAKWWHNQKILVSNPDNGQQVVVRVQDKGPHGKTGAAIDLSPVAMEALGVSVGGSLSQVRFEFAREDAPIGPVH